MLKPNEVQGLTIVRAPGGGMVLVVGPVDLSRAETLSPRWLRDVRVTKPQDIEREADNMGHVIVDRGVPVLTKVGEEVVHGESVDRVQRRANRELGKLLNGALAEAPLTLEVLEGLVRTAKPTPKKLTETPQDKAARAERALGFIGKSDAFVRQALLKAGRKPAQVEKYIRERSAA